MAGSIAASVPPRAGRFAGDVRHPDQLKPGVMKNLPLELQLKRFDSFDRSFHMVLLTLALWLLPASLFMGVTFVEGMANGNRWDGGRIAGLVACLLWPATLPALLVLAPIHYRKNRGKPPALRRHDEPPETAGFDGLRASIPSSPDRASART